MAGSRLGSRSAHPAWLTPLARAARRTFAKEGDTTFWVDVHETPRGLLERFALHTFWMHVEASGYSRIKVQQQAASSTADRGEPQLGAEWWVQHREEATSTGIP